MSRLTVGIVGYDLFPHARCFEDFARGLVSALRTLGQDLVPSTDPKPGRLIMFGANNLLDPNGQIPPDAIVYNSEQVAASRDPSRFIRNFAQYRKHVIWDYSEVNIEAIKKLGIERAVLCPVGYVPSMTAIEPAAEEDIDVLHYGSMNARRREILDELTKAGLRVVHLFGVYGEERDAAIARAKVVLNLHFYERPIFEIFRVSHLLANKKCVVSEDGGQDPILEAFAARAVRLVPRSRIVDVCRGLAADAEARAEQAACGFEAFSKIDLVKNAEQALRSSGIAS